jgi:hypothetical protein
MSGGPSHHLGRHAPRERHVGVGYAVEIGAVVQSVNERDIRKPAAQPLHMRWRDHPRDHGLSNRNQNVHRRR